MPQSQRAAALPPDLQWMHSRFDQPSHTTDPRHPRLDECLLFEAGLFTDGLAQTDMGT